LAAADGAWAPAGPPSAEPVPLSSAADGSGPEGGPDGTVAVVAEPTGTGSAAGEATVVPGDDAWTMTATEPPTVTIASADAAIAPFDLVSTASG